ncbi:MAG: TerB family tellurite resistance protein, partial [Ramlibacter sp.]
SLAEAESAKANDFFHFTSQINDHCSQPDKIALVEAMWQVAYADGGVDANENHVISKVAGLLHVTHGEYIAAKMRAKEDAQQQRRAG